MATKHQQEHQPDAAPTNYEAEFDQLCREMRPNYDTFCRAHPAFRGGYGVYLEVMQSASTVIRNRAELARIEEEQRQLRDALLLPLIYRSGQLAVTEEFADELLSSIAESEQSTQATPPAQAEFIYDGDGELQLVRWGRHDFPLSKMQGRIIHAVGEALKRGLPGLSTRQLVKVIGSDDTDAKISRFFRGPGRAVLDSGFLMKKNRLWTLKLAPERP